MANDSLLVQLLKQLEIYRSDALKAYWVELITNLGLTPDQREQLYSEYRRSFDALLAEYRAAAEDVDKLTAEVIEQLAAALVTALSKPEGFDADGEPHTPGD